MFVLRSGTVKLLATSESGRSIALGIRYPGDSFGLSAVFARRGQTHCAVAVQQASGLALSREQLHAHLARHPETGALLLRELSWRLRERSELVASLALQSVGGRLERALLSLAQLDSAGAPFIVHRPTHRELAEMIGSNRETVTRLLGRMTRRGLITERGRQLRLSTSLAGAAGGGAHRCAHRCAH
jgi:CRP-like cAMP-binding protein